MYISIKKKFCRPTLMYKIRHLRVVKMSLHIAVYLFAELYFTRNQIQLILRRGGAYMPPYDFQGKQVFCPIPLAHPNNYPKQGYTQKNRSLSQRTKMEVVLKSASEICRKNFVNILHFLPLRTKMALARPIWSQTSNSLSK